MATKNFTPPSQTSPVSPGFFRRGDMDKIERLIRANGLYKPTSDEWYNKFSRFQMLNPWRRLNMTKEYLFFTKPDLRIYHVSDDSYFISEQDGKDGKAPAAQMNTALHYDNTSHVPFFQEMNIHYKYILQQLQYSITPGQPFMNLLSNAKRSNLELADISASGDIDSPVNLFNTKISYRGTSYSSDDGYDFTIDFEDSKYLELYRFFKAYDMYENKKHQGLIAVPDKYVLNKILHDQFSIYKFIVDEDFETLIYWAKLTGCYIKSVPRTAFSDLPESGGLTYTVSFRCTFIEDMTPEILSDFNRVSSLIGNGSLSYLYDRELCASNPDWCDRPYVEFENINATVNNPSDNTNYRPKLKWLIKSQTKNAKKLSIFN